MSEPTRPADFGRVDPDGTVYVVTDEGERAVGQVPDADPEEAMDFFVRRFQTLEGEVGLLQARVTSGALSPDEARKAIEHLRGTVENANAVGDLKGLLTRLDGLAPELEHQAEERRAAKAEAAQRAREAKEQMVLEAEKLAESNDWRGGVNRFRALLDEWKALPRIDRATDDALWHRFSTARTTYTRRRKAQFAQQTERWDSAKSAKEQIIDEARGLVDSTEWGPTAGAFRDLMSRWKAAGSASRRDDDELWATFRGLQDQFFAARSAAQHEQDAEFSGNLAAKQALLDQAEADILPVNDVQTARAKYRDFLGKFNELGRVPRESIRPLDARVRSLEQAVQEAEQAEWKRTDPEARQRAQETVAMFEAQIAKLESQAAVAEKAGRAKDAAKAKDAIATYTEWLDQARTTLADFSR